MDAGEIGTRSTRVVAASESRPFGPGWPVRAASYGADPRAVLPAVLWSRGSVRWYAGGLFSLLWMISVGAEVIAVSSSPAAAAVGLTLLGVFNAAFLAAAPIAWASSMRGRLMVCAALFVLSLSLTPWLGFDVAGAWTYIGVIVGMSVLPWRITWLLIAGLAGLALLCGVWHAGEWSDQLLFLPAILLSISMMMAAFARTIASVNQLRSTQDEMAALAAERERGRVARDIHDILGHSLTVITVKAELAARLVDSDPERAKVEIGDVESLARGALADVRSTVSGIRAVTLSGELAAARAALEAAGIAAELPATTDTVPPAHRELFGWVLREGVTNVVRHSEASVCRVRLSAHQIEVADDGVGANAASGTSTGLAGLRERVEAAGGRLSVGRSDLGGFSLRVAL